MADLTPGAVQALKELLERKKADATKGLRLLVQKGGCAGYQYAMKIDSGREGDLVVERGGVRLFVDTASVAFVGDSVVDFSDSLTDGGFKVVNPAAARSCGCGSSFEPGAAAAEAPPPPVDKEAAAMPCASDEGAATTR